MDHLTDLLLAARDGDPAALDAFVRATQVEVWRFCAQLGGREVADDLTQDTYARVVRSVGRFRGDSSARTWLLAIARRSCADHVRSAVRRRRLNERAAVLGRPSTVIDDPTGAYDADALVAELPLDQRYAFVLTQVLGLPYADAADVLGCPIGTIRSRVARAREALADAAVDRRGAAR